MAKYFNNRVKTGKLAGSVFAVRYGETIERAYQPIVSNPKSEAQVGARAKLKLISQLSSVVAPFIAIPREGAVSPRNIFTKENYPLTTFSDNIANISLTAIQLTKSVVGLTNVIVNVAESELSVQLSASAGDLNHVVYVFLQKANDGTLIPKSSTMVSAPGTYNTFPTTYPSIAENIVVLAYGIRDKSELARITFGNMVAPTAEHVAKILVTRVLGENDVAVTETRGVEYTPA